MAKNVKLGIIGINSIGATHANACVKTGAMEIAAICDVAAEPLEEAAKKYDVSASACFKDYRKMLAEADIDAVAVCTPNVFHKEMAIAALEAGKHVFLEKPMAMSAAEGAEILAAAEKAKGVLQMGMVQRQQAQAAELRKLVTEGKLGEIYHMHTVLIRRRGIPGLGGWFTTKAMSNGGPLIDLGVHWFDLAMHISGHWNPTAVSAKTYAKFGSPIKDYTYVSMWAGPPKLDGVCDVEDYATGFVRFGDKATLSFEIAWAANTEGKAFVEILGDKGGARIVDSDDLVVFGEEGSRLTDVKYGFHTEATSYDQQMLKFAAACRGEIPPVATAKEGLTVMKLIDAIYTSSETNKEVVIPG
ncbi:MAG: Gfo/Idh/MocA family oxidoreductase [Phycisphaerae bacterium]|nr:Gfo/Idh/MocA family oxidoreductase [Phycisphaerae bacterium]